MNSLQVTAAGVAAQQQNNLALGAVHIDFTLIKVQPPTEYEGLGVSLSKARKAEAEDHRIHGTASKLGVLFDSIVPNAPNLISAYGKRCSEIAQSPDHNPQGSQKHGLFRDQVGADGTSIWAAATSSTSSIAVHLLACMLARIWDGPRAVSIWTELVSVRKETLAGSGKPMDFHASRIEISRDEISNWDASARAWGLTADSHDPLRQKQLLLIIDHLGLPVNAKIELGESVIEAWKIAMTTVDKLIAGEAQVVHVAAPLLGLAAWHLYPDMVVFGRYAGGPRCVEQKDRLVAHGGVLTLGLEDSRRHGEGIYWSLPLAQLRYYGDPVQTKAQLSTQTSRITVDQLVYIGLGSLVRRWCSEPDDIDLSAELIVKLGDLTGATESSWLGFLANAARSYISAGDVDAVQSAELTKEQKLQLIKLGRRRYPTFIDDSIAAPIFGMSDCTTFLQLLPDKYARMNLLQRVAEDFGEARECMVIQCKPDFATQGWDLVSAQTLWLPFKDNQYIHWTNVTPEGQEGDGPYGNPTTYGKGLRRTLLIHMTEKSEHIPQFRPTLGYTWQNVPRKVFEWICCTHDPSGNWSSATSATLAPKLVFGDPEVAALYSITVTCWTRGANFDAQTYRRRNIRELPNIFILKHVSEALDRGFPSSILMANYLQPRLPGFIEMASHQISLGGISADLVIQVRALMTVCDLYSRLSNASLEMRAASKPLRSHAWLPEIRYSYNEGVFNLTYEETFACIARFESGSFNVSPSAMQGVFAIAHGNSLFVTKRLLQDPNSHVEHPFVERLVGNIGQPGMALLVAPQTLMVRQLSDNYRLVNHFKFDGRAADSFEPTSLHMSFTDWRMPLDVGSRGIRDIEVYYIEAPIKVHDHGDFVADVNILDIFKHAKSRIIPQCEERHEDIEASEIVEKLSGAVTIDSWEELLDSPPEVGVIRVQSNWQARLATAALALGRGHEVRILNNKTCWICATTLPPLKAAVNEQEADSDDEDDLIAVPSSFCYDTGSDSEVDDELEREARRRRKRPRLGVASPRNSPATPPREMHRNIVYIY